MVTYVVVVVEDHRCRMTVHNIGATDTISWYGVWSVGVALNGICVRSGQSGTQHGLGESNSMMAKKFFLLLRN